MTVAIHQPNYFPWLGYFYKIYASDVFVFHDAAIFSKRGFTKRSKIRAAKGSAHTRWLTLPVAAHSSRTAISDLRIAQQAYWAGKHLNAVANTYRSAPFYDENIHFVGDVLTHAEESNSISECNMLIIKQTCKWLGIECDFRQSSKMQLNSTGIERNPEIAQFCEATIYQSGVGARRYQDDTIFEERGISVIYHDIGSWLEEYPYDQGLDSFVGGLSVVDALMWLGIEGVVEKLSAFHHAQSHVV